MIIIIAVGFVAVIFAIAYYTNDSEWTEEETRHFDTYF